MALTQKEKDILEDFIQERINHGYGIPYSFSIKQDKDLKKQIKKEKHDDANIYIRKNVERTYYDYEPLKRTINEPKIKQRGE